MAELLTIRDIASRLGKSFPEVEKMLMENSLEPTERKGMLRFYSKDAVDLLESQVKK